MWKWVESWYTPKPRPWYYPHRKFKSAHAAKFHINGRWVFVPKGTTAIWGPKLDKDTYLCMP